SEPATITNVKNLITLTICHKKNFNLKTLNLKLLDVYDTPIVARKPGRIYESNCLISIKSLC
ncbi:MAG: hypothetical protein ACYS3S_25240, partial [Planctomycetota bacterium]